MMYDTVDDIYSSATNQQRMARHKRSASDASTSPHTLLSAVQRFVASVNGMNDTIMVPCRLLDMEMSNNNSNRPVPDLLHTGQDPYAVYGLLNSTKNDLMYGLSSSEENESLKKERETTSDRWSSNPSCDLVSQTSITSSTNSNPKLQHQHSRKISDLSLMSLSSSTGSCDGSSSSAESDVTEEAEDVDSCLSSEDSTACSSVAQASSELRTHLSGLYTCLNQLSDTALYITERYQEELGGAI